MLQAKKINASMIAVVVLSVLLAIAVSVGATMAWFASADNATGVIGTSGPVEISLEKGVESNLLEDFKDLLLVPSKPVSFDIEVEVEPTDGTKFLMRAQFNLTAQGEEPVNTTVRGEFLEWLELNNLEWELIDDWYYLKTGDNFEQAAVSGDNRVITVLKGDTFVPVDWTNDHANAKFNVELIVQAMQAEVYDSAGTKVTIDNTTIASVFETVFGTGIQPVPGVPHTPTTP